MSLLAYEKTTPRTTPARPARPARPAEMCSVRWRSLQPACRARGGEERAHREDGGNKASVAQQNEDDDTDDLRRKVSTLKSKVSTLVKAITGNYDVHDEVKLILKEELSEDYYNILENEPSTDNDPLGLFSE